MFSIEVRIGKTINFTLKTVCQEDRNCAKGVASF